MDALGVQELVLRARRAALLLLREHLLLLALGERKVQQVVRGHAVARRADLVLQRAVLQQHTHNRESNPNRRHNVVALAQIAESLQHSEGCSAFAPCALGPFWSLVVQTRCSCCTARPHEKQQQHAVSPQRSSSCSSHFIACRASQSVQDAPVGAATCASSA